MVAQLILEVAANGPAWHIHAFRLLPTPPPLKPSALDVSAFGFISE